MKKTEAEILAEVHEKARSLSKMFMEPLDEIDVGRKLEFERIKFNSAYWIIAHLVWTEHFLIIKGISNEDLDIPWLEDYGFGTNSEDIQAKPPLNEVMEKLKKFMRRQFR